MKRQGDAADLRSNYIAMLTISQSGQDPRVRVMLTQSYTELFRSGVGRVSRMSEKFVAQAQPVPFGERLASSQAFAELFREGMALVEETATYLDGPGRQQSKKLHWLMRRKVCVSPPA